MKWIGRALMLVILLVVVTVVWQRVAQVPTWLSKQSLPWDDGYGAFNIFWLPKDKPLQFDIPANAEQIRVQLTPQLLHGADKPQRYQVLYQTLDNRGRPRDKVTREFVDTPEQNNRNAEGALLRFFDSPDSREARFTRGFFIDTPADQPISGLQLQLLDSDGFAVAVRVAVLERNSEDKLPILWQRLRRDQKEELLAEHIYPPALVPEAEKQAALALSWQPLGPRGVAGEDWQSGTLFVINKLPHGVEQVAPSVGAMVAGPGRLFGIERSKVPQVVSLQCAALDGTALDWLELHWQKAEGEPLQLERFEHLDNPIGVPDDEHSLLWIEAGKPCHVTLFDEQSQKVSVSSQAQRGYVIEAGRPLRFALAANQDNTQPLRFDLRQLQGGGDMSLGWRLYGQNNQILDEGSTAVGFANDEYEALPIDNITERLGARVSRYLAAAAGAERLELFVEKGAVLINAYSRPLLLPYQPWQTELPKWFTLLPIGNVDLRLGDRSRLFYQQIRPSLPDEDEQAERPGQWQAVSPEGGQPSRALLASVAEDAELSPRSRYSLIGVDWSGELIDDRGRKQVRPGLAYVRDSSEPHRIEVQIDDQHPQEYWLAARAGLLRLPTLSAGIHRLAIDGGEGIQWHLNHQAKPQAQAKRVRRAYPVGQQLYFDVVKSERRQWITLRWFARTLQAHRLTVQLVRDFPAGQYPDHTVPIRSFDIVPKPGQSDVAWLDQAEGSLAAGVSLGFALAPDLPKGRYRLKVTTDIPDAGLLQAVYHSRNAPIQAEHYTEVPDAL